MSMQNKMESSVFQQAAARGPRAQRLRCQLVGFALTLCLASCSSNDSSSPAAPAAPPPPPAVTSISGTVVEAFVVNATLTAYEVSSTGTIGSCVPAASGSGCATATSDSSGAYTLKLGGGYTGPVLLESTGGSYTDTVTGQTVPIPPGLILSAFLPSVTSGTNTVQPITGLTTVAAQLALQAMAQGASAASAASTASTGVQTAFGFPNTAAETATLETKLLNLNDPNCGTAGQNQASFDVSLVLAGIAQLAAQNGVTSYELTFAIVADIVSDGKVDGMAGGLPIILPLASGNGSVNLKTIYGEALAISLEASILFYQGSIADACQATQSPALSTALSSAPTNLASEQYQYTATGTVSGLTAGNTVSISFSLDLTCSSDVLPGSGTPTGTITDNGNGTFSLSIGGSNSAGSPLNYSNSCGSNTGTVQVTATGGQTCLVAASGGSPAASATFTFTDATDSHGNETDTASGIAITCNTAPPPTLYTVGGMVTQLPTGASVTISDTVNGDNVTVSGPATVSAPVAFTLPAQLGNGTGYQVTAAAAPNTCTVSNASGAINGANVTNVAVACSSSAVVPPSALYGPRGIEFHNNLLFVPNYSANQVLVLSEQTNTSNQVTGLTQVASIPAQHLYQPARAAFDANGNLYVANQGSSGVTGSQSVSVYDSSYTEITASGGGPLISGAGLTGPIGVAVDSLGNVYVANDPGDTISVFTAKSATNPAAGYTGPTVLSQDAAGTSFATPLMIVDENIPGAGEYVLVGLSSNPTSRVLVYAPLKTGWTPIYDLAGVAGCTMPAGPTGIALSGTSMYVASSYGTKVFEYAASTLIGGGSNPCVAPAATNGTDMLGVEGVASDSFNNVFVANAGSFGPYANTITVYAGSSFGNSEAPLYTYEPIATLACNSAPSPKGGGAQPYDNQSYCAMGFTGTTDVSYTFAGTLTFTTPSAPGALSNCAYVTTGTITGSPTVANTGPMRCTGTTDASGNLTITDGSGNGFTGAFSSDGTKVTGTYNFTDFGPNSGAAGGSFSGTQQ